MYRALDRLGLSPLRLTPEERMEIIAGLEADGIFLLKGAVKPVADALQCSQASIYRYLSQIRAGPDGTAQSSGSGIARGMPAARRAPFMRESAETNHKNKQCWEETSW